MVRILAECPEKIASVELGIIKSLQPLCDKSECDVRFKRTAEITKKDILWADIVISVRGCETFSCSIIRAAKKADRLCLYFLDDDLLHIPEESISYAYFQDPLIQDNMKTILSLCDALWGTNDRIRSIYGPMCGGGKWILARMPVKLDIVDNEAEKDCVKILYAGSVDHQVIVRELLAPAADKLSVEYGSGISFTFIGPDPKLPKRENIVYKKYMADYNEYKAFVKTGGYDIGLAPTRTTDFFRAKYYNKFVEYTSIGAAGIYTDSEPYTQVVQNGVNGLLCENSADGWYNSIKQLIEDSELRKNCYQKAKDVLVNDYRPEAVAAFLVQQFPAFIDYHAPEIPINTIHLPNPFWSIYFGRVKLCWRNYGVLCIPVIFYKAVKLLIRAIFKEIFSFVHKIL